MCSLSLAMWQLYTVLKIWKQQSLTKCNSWSQICQTICQNKSFSIMNLPRMKYSIVPNKKWTDYTIKELKVVTWTLEKEESPNTFLYKKYKFGQRDGKHMLYKPGHWSLILKPIHMNVGTGTNAKKSFPGHRILHNTCTPACTHNNKNKVYVKKDNI